MLETLKRYCRDPKNATFVDVALFVILIIGFHFLFLGWQALGYRPVSGAIGRLSEWAVDLLFSQSCWMLENLFHIDISTVSDLRLIATPNRDGGWARVIIAPECASLKQWCHWLFLMLLFPGPWKHKAWFIPLGLIIIEWANVMRICGILMLQIPWPNSFRITHDYIFKLFFYLVIFLMWVVWAERFAHSRGKGATIDETNN